MLRRGAALAILLPALAAAEGSLVARRAQIACGPAIITADALCHGASPLCERETLTFRQVSGSTILAPHRHKRDYPTPDGGKLAALEYRATAWSCARGANGGRYLALVMTRADSADCGECQFARLYHPNGRVIASTLRFDADGAPHGDARSAAVLREVLGRPWPDGLRLIHDR